MTIHPETHLPLSAVLLLCFVPVCQAEPERKPARPPNIIFLLTDDQRPDTIAALGNLVIQTPNLDSLVRGGTAFTRAVSPNPLCVPSRAEILTGCTGFRNGVLPGFSNRLDLALPLWPETMRKAGYRTCYVGKWHTVGRPSQRGYDESRGLYAGGKGIKPPAQVDHAGREVTGYRGWVFQTDDGRLFPEKGIGLTPDISRYFADAAIAFINTKPAKPFFLHVNFTAPHDPLLIPPGYAKKYDPNKVPFPRNFLPRHPFDHGNFNGRDEKLLPWPRTEKEVRREIAVYYAVISHLDEQIGRILKSLDETGQADNTVVIFSSDHGLALGSHGLRGKQNMYEHTVGVPLLLKGPGIPRGKRLDAQVYLRDLYPTACDLAGIPVPKTPPPRLPRGVFDERANGAAHTEEGRSLVPLLTGKVKELYPEIFGYFTDTQRMVRTERWKLIHYPKAMRYQLFDLQADPDERRDLSGDRGQREVFERLKKRLERWQKEVEDPLVKRDRRG
jgi:arylsulfatase A-like enzyme